MEVSILQENLLQALYTLIKFVPTKPQLPILSTILLQANRGGLTLKATDLQVSVTTIVRGKISKNGEIAIPGKVFLEYISSLSPETLLLSTKEHGLEILTENTKTILQGIISQEFPKIPEKPDKKISISLEDFSSAIEMGGLSAGLDETRPIFSSILFENSSKKNLLEVVGTDGYRLSKKEIFVKEWGKKEKILFPSKILKEISRVLRKNSSGTVECSLLDKENMMYFLYEDFEFFIRLVEGDFPDYRAIIPEEFQIQITTEADPLLRAVRTALIFSRESSGIIKLSLLDNQLTISSLSSAIGEHSSTLPIEYEKKGDGVIAFNGKYLLDFLLQTKADRVWFGMNESLKPGMFKKDGDNSFLYIVMPFKIQDSGS